jgi:hypothetical protein
MAFAVINGFGPSSSVSRQFVSSPFAVQIIVVSSNILVQHNFTDNP